MLRELMVSISIAYVVSRQLLRITSKTPRGHLGGYPMKIINYAFHVPAILRSLITWKTFPVIRSRARDFIVNIVTGNFPT